jgi:hypothetical protein
MKEKKNKIPFGLVCFIISLLLLILLIIGIYVFNNRKAKVVNVEENGGNIVLNYTNHMSGLSLENIIPTTDSVAKKGLLDGEYFDFSVSLSLDNATEIEYEIALIKNTKKTTIKDDDIKVYLEQEKSGTYSSVLEPTAFTPIKSKTKLGSPAGSMVLYSIKKSKSGDDNYRLRIWLSDTSLVDSGNVEVEVQIFGVAR